jgi:rSAM/selenodomain-associated transferase 2
LYRVRISVVIPVLNEAATIAEALRGLARQGPDEIVVVDASSPDGTAELARTEGVTVIDSPRGRGVQQNRGAAATSGDTLLFLHADCRLGERSIAGLRRFLVHHPRVVGGCFRMRVAEDRWLFRCIDVAANLRAGLLGITYGDQGIFVTRRVFDRIGGFPETPLMEDVGFSLQMRRLGRVAVLPLQIAVSPRRWARHGLIGQTARNWALLAAAAAGVPALTLARFYPPVR